MKPAWATTVRLSQKQSEWKRGKEGGRDGWVGTGHGTQFVEYLAYRKPWFVALNYVWWCMPVILALQRWRQEGHKFVILHPYSASLRLA